LINSKTEELVKEAEVTKKEGNLPQGSNQQHQLQSNPLRFFECLAHFLHRYLKIDQKKPSYEENYNQANPLYQKAMKRTVSK